jgi:hypothetical protein
VSPTQIIALCDLASRHYARQWLVNDRELLKFYVSLVMRLTMNAVIRECVLRAITRTLLGAQP